MMESKEWLEQAIQARVDELRHEYGYNEELSDTIDNLEWSLRSPIKEKVETVITEIIQSHYDDMVNVYRGAFRDGLQYGIEILNTEGEEACTSLENLLTLLEKACREN